MNDFQSFGTKLSWSALLLHSFKFLVCSKDSYNLEVSCWRTVENGRPFALQRIFEFDVQNVVKRFLKAYANPTRLKVILRKSTIIPPRLKVRLLRLTTIPPHEFQHRSI